MLNRSQLRGQILDWRIMDGEGDFGDFCSKPPLQRFRRFVAARGRLFFFLEPCSNDATTDSIRLIVANCDGITDQSKADCATTP
jgi:hypothetical protein